MDEIIVIDIFGEEFRFKPDDQVENPEKIADNLKKYIAEAEELFRTGKSGKNKIAIHLLAAMNLSKDFHELELKYSELEKNMYTQISSLIKKIDLGIE